MSKSFVRRGLLRRTTGQGRMRRGESSRFRGFVFQAQVHRPLHTRTTRRRKIRRKHAKRHACEKQLLWGKTKSQLSPAVGPRNLRWGAIYFPKRVLGYFLSIPSSWSKQKLPSRQNCQQLTVVLLEVKSLLGLCSLDLAPALPLLGVDRRAVSALFGFDAHRVFHERDQHFGKVSHLLMSAK